MTRFIPAAALPAKPPLGFWPALALVVGNMIGSGIYLLPASLAPLGANALWGWVITLIGATGLAFIFARLSARLPLAGGAATDGIDALLDQGIPCLAGGAAPEPLRAGVAARGADEDGARLLGGLAGA